MFFFSFFFFFFNDTATTEIYTLSLHDALPILFPLQVVGDTFALSYISEWASLPFRDPQDRKSTRLNSRHEWISYADFCLQKKKIKSRPAIVLYERIIELEEYLVPNES